MGKNLKSFRLTVNSIEKIRKIKEENKLKDETKALEHIITNYDMQEKPKERKIIKVLNRKPIKVLAA
jgi:hypothetical protein